MCTRERETKVEATVSASYSEEEEEEVEEDEKTDLSLPGRKSLHWREKPDLPIKGITKKNKNLSDLREAIQNNNASSRNVRERKGSFKKNAGI